MTRANVSQAAIHGLPPTMRTAQEAMGLPEIQAMLRTLSDYNLGICMPHMHDGRTGWFQPLADQPACASPWRSRRACSSWARW